MTACNGHVNTLAPGTRVQCHDREPANYGRVIADSGGERVRVHFVSPSGQEAFCELPRAMVEAVDRPGPAIATGPVRAAASPERNSHLDDLSAARLLLRIAGGQEIDSELVDRLTPEWVDGASYVADWPGEGIQGWLAVVAERDPSRAVEISTAIDEALATPDAGPPKPEYASLADAVALIGSFRWLWADWIPRGVLTLLAARGGVGKTRLAIDLAYRLWAGLPWPDGSTNTYPSETTTLWILVDRNWQETGEVARNFGLPLDAIRLNSSKESPLTTPELDDPATIAALADQIRDERPGLVVIDTITYATSRNMCRAEDVKAALDGLIQVAAETGVPILALAHVSLGGEALGRRITERARCVLSLVHPDPDGQRNRRKLWVSKSAAKKPSPLGVTLKDSGQSYDTNPPEAPEADARPRGPAPAKSNALTEWLYDRLSVGPMSVVSLVQAAQDEGHLPAPTPETPKPSISALYRARDRIPALHPGHAVEEFEGAGDHSARQLKHWRLS
jgi:hypothetical protein